MLKIRTVSQSRHSNQVLLQRGKQIGVAVDIAQSMIEEQVVIGELTCIIYFKRQNDEVRQPTRKLRQDFKSGIEVERHTVSG